MLLSCPLCCKPHFEGVDSLRTTLINVATAPLTCPVCQETLKGLDKLTIHLFGHVNGDGGGGVVSEGPVKVKSVNKEGDRGGRVVVVSAPSSDVIEEEIDRSISSIGNTTNQETLPEPQPTTSHPQETQNEIDEVISCDICSFTFTDRNILDMHQKLLHQTTPDEKTGKYSYHCHLCSKRFRMRGSLMVHLKVAHYGFENHRESRSHQENNQEKTEKENGAMDIDLEAKGKPQDFKQWSCDVCTKMFTTKYFLKKHKRLHTGEMPYSCSICNKAFTFQQSYHKHMLYHSSEKPYVCNECGRAFKEHSTLQNHARIHSGERPFGCEICGKRFRQRVSYLVHKRIHTGVMPYKCTACDKSFRYKVSQRSHKCPVNPPGNVIKINEESISSVNTTNLINDKGPILPEMTMTTPLNSTEQPSLGGKAAKCIMKVDYDTGNINLVPESGMETKRLCDRGRSCQEMHKPGLVDHRYIEDCLNKECLVRGRDCYPMVMSPMLPEVGSLCLNNNSPISHCNSPLEENIQEIREKCLEELFK